MTPGTLVLVGCGAAKRDESAPAKDLYTSSYFDLKRRYAEAAGDRWAILSAEHAIVHPNRDLAPYDTTMSDVDAGEWAHRVMGGLYAFVDSLREFDGASDVELVFLAGRDYTDPLRARLDSMVWTARYPFDDTAGIGEQMGWLSAELDELEAA